MDTTHSMGQQGDSPEKVGSDLLNIDVWEAIDNDLGAITDFKLAPFSSQFTPYVITYKSNGGGKSIYLSDLKSIIQCLVYCGENFTTPSQRKYLPAS